MYSAIARNKRNTVFIILLFLMIIGGLAWLASVVYVGPNGDPTIVIVVIVVATIYAIVQYFAASRLAVSMAGGHEIRKSDNPRLYRTVENIAITTGLPTPKIYIVDDPSPNAFATGRDPKTASVAVTTGLLDIMDDQELEAVMAHEMGHVQNYDIRVTMIVFGLVVAVGMIADMLLRISIYGGGRNRNNNGGSPLVIVFGLAAMIVAPLVAAAVQAAVSRQREYLADATSAMTTRNAPALASALEKLAAYGQPMRRQNSTMAHLWIADPMRPGFMSRLFSTHPPIQDRVARLEKIGRSF